MKLFLSVLVLLACSISHGTVSDSDTSRGAEISVEAKKVGDTPFAVEILKDSIESD